MLVADTQLIGRANHGVAAYAANLARLKLAKDLFIGMAVKQHGPGQSDDDLLATVADLEVWGAGDHGLGLASAIFHGSQSESISVRMTFDLQDLADDDLVGRPDRAPILLLDVEPLGRGQTDQANAAHFQAGQRQALDQRGYRARQVHVIPKPV